MRESVLSDGNVVFQFSACHLMSTQHKSANGAKSPSVGRLSGDRGFESRFCLGKLRLCYRKLGGNLSALSLIENRRNFSAQFFNLDFEFVGHL